MGGGLPGVEQADGIAPPPSPQLRTPRHGSRLPPPHIFSIIPARRLRRDAQAPRVDLAALIELKRLLMCAVARAVAAETPTPLKTRPIDRRPPGASVLCSRSADANNTIRSACRATSIQGRSGEAALAAVSGIVRDKPIHLGHIRPVPAALFKEQVLFGDRAGHQDHYARVDSVVGRPNSAPCFPQVVAPGMA
jgi:hypothetical protein